MPKPHKVVNCDQAYQEFTGVAWALYQEHKHVTFEWRVGVDRSLSQNALFHIWLTQYAAHLLKIPRKDVNKGILQGIKEKTKERFYLEYPYDFMIHKVIDPWHPDKARLDYTSSAAWRSGEMYLVLSWLQNVAAQDGLILESKGEFAKNKRKENH